MVDHHGNQWGSRGSLPKKICLQCGKTIAPRQSIDKHGRSRGWYTPPKYCSHDCANAANNPPKNKLNARGWSFDKHGYVILTERVKGTNYQQPQHRAVMEAVLGRKLEKHETVHHKNGDRADNRPENLELWAGRHGRGQRAKDLPDIWSGNIPNYLVDCWL
jgi:hypothetical protein